MFSITGPIIVTCALMCLTLTGCNKSLVYDNEVTFKGYVYAGHNGQDANGNSVIINNGPISGATVTAVGHSSSVSSASDGSYILAVPAVRTFSAPDTDTYTLEAHTPSGSDEKITASGKPGETVNVRGFVLTSHTEAQ